MPEYPKRIILELSNACNLRCIMCAQNHVNFDKSFLNLELIRDLDKFYRAAGEVTLFGYGEPLLNSAFPEMLELLSTYENLKIYLLTNGSLLGRFSEIIVKNRLAYLSVSVDGATEETYQRIRRRGVLSDVLTALESINKIKKKYKSESPHIRFVFVAMRDNIMELPLLLDIARRYGVAEVKVEYLVVHKQEMADQSLFYHRELLAYFMKAKIKANECGIKLRLPPMIGEDDLGDKMHRECKTPFDTLFVSSNGAIRACMISNRIFGNLNVDSLESIWFGDEMNAFRKKVNTDDPPEDCANCWQASHLNVNREQAHVRLNVNIAAQGIK